MRILIAEDDLTSRRFLLKFLSQYGECDVVVDGMEALDAFLLAAKDGNPYNVICLDIMMPKVDGVKVLKAVRDFETRLGLLPQKRSKVIMVTALAETLHVQKAFEIGCEAYTSKPVDIGVLEKIMERLGFEKVNSM